MKIRSILFAAASLALLAGQAQAAVTVYTDRAAWEAAVGSFTEQNFNAFTAAQAYDASAVNVGDFTVSLTGTSFGSSWHNIGPVSNGNDVNGTPQLNAATGEVGGTFLTFASAIMAFGGNWAGISDDRETSLSILGDTWAIPNLNGGFWGVVSDSAFTTLGLVLTAGPADGFGLDNVVYSGAVPEPESLALMGLGVAALAAVRRRRSA